MFDRNTANFRGKEEEEGKSLTEKGQCEYHGENPFPSTRGKTIHRKVFQIEVLNILKILIKLKSMNTKQNLKKRRWTREPHWNEFIHQHELIKLKMMTVVFFSAIWKFSNLDDIIMTHDCVQIFPRAEREMNKMRKIINQIWSHRQMTPAQKRPWKQMKRREKLCVFTFSC